jgi:hypothetical protein
MGLAATHRVDGGRSLVVGNEEMRGLRRAVAACWSREKRSQGVEAFGYLFFPDATHGHFSYLYIIIKKLRFLPKNLSKLFLDRFAVPPNRIILHNCHCTVSFILFPLPER